MMQKVLVYTLHSGSLYGTERMALATLAELRSEFKPVLLSPGGKIVRAAKELDIEIYLFRNAVELGIQTWRILAKYKDIRIITTGVKHALLLWGCNLWYKRTIKHIHAVHGGTNERDSYGRKHYLNYMSLHFVVNSRFVYERLQHYCVPSQRIKVIENFLPTHELIHYPHHPSFHYETGVNRIIIVSRLEPIKRVQLILDALDYMPRLAVLEVHVFGTGIELVSLQARAKNVHPNVKFLGFSNQIPEELSKSDLLVHLCPEEPFGLVVLEAMAAKIPVLVPNTGGVAGLVENEVSGFHFQANDIKDLAHRLWEIRHTSAHKLNEVVENAYQSLQTRFSTQRCIDEYRTLLD